MLWALCARQNAGVLMPACAGFCVVWGKEPSIFSGVPFFVTGARHDKTDGP
ncbi:non-ribosomal peptide synthetase [Acetobacter orientalis]|uniref:Non-ribosomal peptide synthetase n=1 Tax=Acetobacter orientalis TaxID=146474 RepID=A0A2Z5ZJA9_9PROT|nr:non-ribosomal peptide synthetase [Acetobacter orientalis]